MNAARVRSSRPRPRVAMIEIDIPPTNALGREARAQFLSHLTQIENDLELRVAVVVGRGKGFCSGDDLKEREAARGKSEDTASRFAALVDRIEALRVPVIAAVNGWAIGGGVELALACDARIASRDAQFVCAAVNVGLIASAYRLPRLIGIARAKHMLLTGLPVDAESALQYGLVTSIHAPDKLVDGALELADHIASRAPLSVEATKRVAGAAPDLDGPSASKLLGEEFAALVRSQDHAEALAAFREKRPPQFRRR